jgi:hypothetical protein
MTGPVPPPDDELVSAHLDGAATPDEAAAVEASAPARARRRELEAVRARVGEPVVPPPGARDAAIAAALAVYDRDIAGGDPTATDGRAPAAGDTTDRPVASIDERRARRPRRSLVPVLGAVASVVLILGVLVGLRISQRATPTEASLGAAARDQNNSKEAPAAGPPPPGSALAATGAESSNQDDSAVAAPADRPSAPLSEPAPGAAGTTNVVDLGPVTDAASFRRAVGDALAGRLVAGPTSSATPYARGVAVEPRACEAARRAGDSEVGELVLTGVAQYNGAPAGVLVFRLVPAAPRAADGAVRAYLSEPSTCRVLRVETI